MPTTSETRATDGVLRVPRSRGAVSGLLLLLLGVWGALIPFLGPTFSYGYGPSAWTMTSGRFWYELLPGIACAVAGLLLMGSGDRISGSSAAGLGAAAGTWFLIGPTLGPVFHMGQLGAPIGTGTWRPALDGLGLTSGLGAAIVLLSALAAGRFSVRGVRDARLAAKRREQAHQGAGEPEVAARDTYPSDTTVGDEPSRDERSRFAGARTGRGTTIPDDEQIGRGEAHDRTRDAGSRSVTDR